MTGKFKEAWDYLESLGDDGDDGWAIFNMSVEYINEHICLETGEYTDYENNKEATHNWKYDSSGKTFEEAFIRMYEKIKSAVIEELLCEAVETPGAHHKQWYLEQIAKNLNIDLPKHEKGIAP